MYSIHVCLFDAVVFFEYLVYLFHLCVHLPVSPTGYLQLYANSENAVFSGHNIPTVFADRVSNCFSVLPSMDIDVSLITVVTVPSLCVI